MQYLTLQKKYVAYRVPCSNDSLNQYCYKTFCKFLCLTHILPVHYGLNKFLLDLKYFKTEQVFLLKRIFYLLCQGAYLDPLSENVWNAFIYNTCNKSHWALQSAMNIISNVSGPKTRN